MSTYSVQVSGISPSTTQEQLSEFFSFCGKIASIEHSPTTQSANVHFEKPSAAKTALMLNGGNLDGATLTVTSEKEHPDEPPSAHHDGTFEQSDKPRAAIAAEYLATGYKLSDHVLERAIALDNKHGISSRFVNYIQQLDTQLGQKALGPDKTISGKVQEHIANVTQQARTIDQQKGYTKTANDYYAKAITSPLGQKVLSFYTTTSKQVLDIHEEARRISASQKHSGNADAPTAISTGVGTAAPPLNTAVHTTEKPLA